MLPTLPFAVHHCATKSPDVCLALRCTREGILANLNRRITGTPYITFAYGTEFLRYPPGSRRGRMVRRIIDESARTFCISEFTRRALAERGCSPDRLSVMCPGIDRLPTNLPGQEEARDRLNLHGGPVLLSVSRLVPHKGHDTVLRALPRLRSRWSGLQYVVVGKGVHEAALRQLAQAVGVAEAVRFVGYVPDGDLANYYAACDVFVMPSREEQGSVEGFGISFLEAAAHGRPAVGGRGTGAEDAIADGVSGVLVEPTSEVALAEAVSELLTDEGRRLTMGEAARVRVAAEFTWERAVEAVEEALLEAAGRRLGTARA
jgi:phosphatidylinositol alpha-1,6-mannosyltransferase